MSRRNFLRKGAVEFFDMLNLASCPSRAIHLFHSGIASSPDFVGILAMTHPTVRFLLPLLDYHAKTSYPFKSQSRPTEFRMKISQSFSYMFKDPSWFFKVFVGGLFLLLSFVVVGIPFVLGYEVALIKGKEKELVLPDWNEAGKKFREGAIVLGAGLAYAFLTYLILGFFFKTPSVIPQFVAAVTGAFVWLPLVMVQFASKGTLLSCFIVPSIFSRLYRKPGPFATVLGVSILVIASTVTFGWMTLIVGWPFVVFWGIAVQAHLLGQAARLS